MTERPTPVYVIGPGHSGTGILYRMLALHPDFSWLSQFSGRTGNIPGRAHIPIAPWIDRNIRRISPHDWRKKHGGLRQKALARPKEGHAVWDYIVPKNGGITKEESIARLHALLENEMARLDKPFFVTKLPRLYKHIDILAAADPESRFIQIVRDGRAMALSQRYKPRRASLEGERALAKLDWAAGFWSSVISEVRKHSGAIRLKVIRYEDFCRDVHGNLRDLLEFVGARPDVFPYADCPATLTVTNDRWLANASPQEIGYLEEKMSPLLQDYGYQLMQPGEVG